MDIPITPDLEAAIERHTQIIEKRHEELCKASTEEVLSKIQMK